MQLNEVSQKIGLSKRAIKFYEEKGLLKVEKSSNGYRNYTEENIRTLKEISVYRKLGISLKDIKTLLKEKDSDILEQIYEEKKQSLSASQKELDALSTFLKTHNVDAIYSVVDYQSIGQALQEMIPGVYGFFFMHHFLPYLQEPITTPEQQKAYETIIEFLDNTKIRIPLFLRLFIWLTYRFNSKTDIKIMVQKMDSNVQSMLHPTEEEFEKFVTSTKKYVKARNRRFSKLYPFSVSQRRLMKQMKNCGYNDIFIPAMIELSPKYREYQQALSALNQRICKELGLYYDSEFRMVMKG